MERERSPARRISLLATAFALAACLWASPGHGQETAAQPGEEARIAAADLRKQALAAMEALREEIVTLTALRNAQAALLAWNRASPWNRETPWSRASPRSGEIAATGTPGHSLPAALCAEPALAAWCRLLPATFGAPTAEEDHDGN